MRGDHILKIQQHHSKRKKANKIELFTIKRSLNNKKITEKVLLNTVKEQFSNSKGPVAQPGRALGFYFGELTHAG